MKRSTQWFTGRFAAPMVTAVVLSLLGLNSPAVAAEEAAVADPHTIVRSASADLVALIQDAKSYADEDPERYYTEVQSLLDPLVDFRSFSKLVMAVHYRRATPEQRGRFARTFKRSLVRTYANALLKFTDEEIRVLDPTGPPKNPKLPSVDMEIRTAGGAVYPMTYWMGRSKSGSWQMKNIIINGINIGLTFRNQFASAVRSRDNGGDLDKVIDGWGDLVATVDATGTKES